MSELAIEPPTGNLFKSPPDTGCMGNNFTKSWGAEALPQPEEAAFYVLEANNKGPLTAGTWRHFPGRSGVSGAGMAAVKFLVVERFPSIKEALGVILIFSMLGMLVMWLSTHLNAIAKKRGIAGIIAILLAAGAILVAI